ncbi:Cna protein B-type domain-containing protein [Ruaniaceae bacterium KH17]|nr:Cna protein B-type domain-containing protein [Ruaniaceae bacterium KH17]
MESTRTYGCLYATVEQVRPVTVTKVVESPYGTAPTATFSYTSQSSLAGAPWATSPWTLQAGGSVTRNYNSGEAISITEGTQSSPWAFTSLTCVDGAGASIGTVSGQTVTIPAGTTTTSADAAPITCTYTNTYTPRATLTLVKSVNSTGQPAPVAVPADWTLTAQGTGSVSSQSISGAGNSAAVTSQSVIAGTYALSEVANNSSTTGGYVQDGSWTCTNNVTVTDGQITLTNGQSTTCTVTNKYQTGSLALTKTVTSSPAGGYTQGTSKSFTAQYVCTVGDKTVTGTQTVYPNATNGQPGATVTIPNLPANASCVITELNPPSGSTDLVNSSWVWGTPTYSASQTVTVEANGTATVNITNPVTQNTGSLVINKVVTARAGTPAAGYTGGTRTFPINYSCSIGGTTTASGTVNVGSGQSQTVQGIPSTSTCVLSETLSEQDGDFADVSFRWDGNAFSQPTAIPVDGTASGTVTNYFVRDMVDLTIAKRVDGAGYTSGDFSIAWQCGSGVGGTLTLAGGASQTVQVPAGVACTVVEQDARPDLAPGYVWDDETYEGLTNGTVTVPRDGTGSVTVVNPTSIGFNRISLTKEIAHFADQVSTGTEFDVTVTCDAPAQGQANNYTDVFTFETPLSGALETPYLPIGTSCTVEETRLPSGSTALPGSSYVWSTTPVYEGLVDGAVTVPQSTTPAPVKVINDVERVYGPLSITKTVSTPAGVSVSGPFTGTWSCTFGGSPHANGTWTAPASGGAATLTNASGNYAQLLIGSLCTVTENDPANPVPGDNSYVWAVETPSSLNPITTDGETAKVTNTLNRNTGSFSVTKSVSGGTAGTDFEDTDFTFDYVCTPLSGDPITGVLTMEAGGSASPTQEIPVGSTCEVTERTNSLPNPIDPNRWDDVAFAVSGATGTAITDGTSFVTPDDATVAVAVTATNTMSAKTGSVSVTKSVTQLDDGFTGGSSAIFPMTLTCEDPRTGASAQVGTQSIANGQTYTWNGIPVGADCSVQEGSINGGLKDASFGWNAPQYSVDSVTVTVDGTANMTVTNTLHRVYGEISLNKVFDDAGFTGVVPTDRSYSGTWTCTYDGATVAAGTWSGTGSSSGTPASLVATTGSLDEIPLTASCSATEDSLSSPSSSDSSYRWESPVISGIDSVSSAASENVATVTNTLARDTGSVTVKKVISGQTTGFVPGDGFSGFPVGIVCALTPEDLANTSADRLQNEVRVQAGADAVTLISGVPRGWVCAANEGAFVTAEDNWLRDDSFAWGAPVLTVDGSALAGSFPVGATPSEVQVENPITRQTGTIEITKAIGSQFNDVVNDDASFSGAYECVYGQGEAYEETFSGTWTVDGTGAATLAGNTVLPYGTVCSVTETDPDDDDLVDASWTWGIEDVAAEPNTVSGNGPASFTVTNTPERVYSTLAITKELTGPADSFEDPDLTVSGVWACTYRGSTVSSGTWVAPAIGGAATLSPASPQIPVTSSCVVQEDTLDDDVFKDASYTWGPPPSDQNTTIVAGEVASVTVTNVVERQYGTFTITKLIERGEGVTDQVPGTDVTYGGTYECTYAGESLGVQNWTITGEGNSFTAPESLYADTTCVVLTESTPSRLPVPADESFVWGEYTIGEGVTIGVDTASNVDVTNRVNRLTGSFTVTKVFEGDADGLPESPTYDFEWACVAGNGDEYPSNDDDASFSLAAGGTWNPAEVIPYGSACTVTETGAPEPLHPSFEWSTAMSVSGATGTPDGSTISFVTPSADGAVLVTATNTLTRAMSDFAVTKVVPEGSTADETLTYSGNWSCVGPLDSDVAITGTWGPITAGTTWSSGSLSDVNIPLDSTCTVTSETRETWPVVADHAHQWDGDPDLGSEVVTTAGNEPVTITVTNRTHRVLGAVTWAKVDEGGDRLSGSEWLLEGPDDFSLEIDDCIADNAADCAGPDLDPSAGGFEIDGLAWGEYTLTETKAPAGYRLLEEAETFTIGAGEPGALEIEELGDIENTPITPPSLPLTGGLGRDFFTILGLTILALGLGAMGFVTVRGRREVA